MTDHGQNGFVEDKAAPSEQVLRPTDSRLVNVDRLAQEIARAMGFARVEFALKVITIANAVFARASRGEIQLYCEDRPFPFDKDENESMHGGLRLTKADADALRAFYLDSLSDPLAKPNQTPQATALAQQRHKPYNRSHFEALMAPCGVDEYITIDARGVWPSIKFDIGLIAETNLFRWKPAQVFGEDQDAPDVEAEPSLPFPFDARQLAVFMLDGVGSFIADYYGGVEDGLDEEAIKEIDPGNRSAIRAVREAFEACRESRTALGCLDGEWPDTNSMVRQLLAREIESAQQEVAADRANHGHKSNAEHLGDSAQGQGGSSWTLNKPKRSGGYRPALHRLLKAAHLEGKEIPSAREVLEDWRISRPDEIARVLSSGFDYYDAKGDEVPASLDALKRAIDRLTKANKAPPGPLSAR